GGDVMDHRLAGQARRQRLAAVTIRLGLGRTRSRRRLGDRIRLRGGRGLGLRQDVLSEEQELVGIDRLGLAAVAVAEELFELMLELRVEMELLCERLQQLADELMGGLEVAGEWVSRGDHTPYYADVCSFVG